jgi:hypothetical protein
MQEPPRVETDLHVFLAQEGDEVFNESQRFLVEGFFRKVAPDLPQDLNCMLIINEAFILVK